MLCILDLIFNFRIDNQLVIVSDMKVVSVINYKGGVGKTTLSANLSAELAHRGNRVLMIDLDPQTSLTFSFIQPDVWIKNYAKKKTIKSWFNYSSNKVLFKDLIIELEVSKDLLGELHLISSHLELINIDLELATKLGGVNLKDVKRSFIRVHQKLLQGIEQVRTMYDYIIIDCPPNFNIITKNAIVASDSILIPAKPDYLSTLGIDYLKRSVDGLVKDYNEFCEVLSEDDEDEYNKITPVFLGVVFTMVQFYRKKPIASIRQYINQTIKLGVPVFDTYIRENKSIFADAPHYGIPVVLAKHHREDIIKEICNFVTDFELKA